MVFYLYNFCLYEGTNLVRTELTNLKFGFLNSIRFRKSLNIENGLLFSNEVGFFSLHDLFLYFLKLSFSFRYCFVYFDKKDYLDFDMFYKWMVFLLINRWFIRVYTFNCFRKNRKRSIKKFNENYFFFSTYRKRASFFFRYSFIKYWFKIRKRALFPFFKIVGYNNTTLLNHLLFVNKKYSYKNNRFF